jgi:hypothetical protein
LAGSTTFIDSAPQYLFRINAQGNRILLPTANKRSGNLWSYPELKLIQQIELPDTLSIWEFVDDKIFAGTQTGDVHCWSASDGSFLKTFKNIGQLHSVGFDPSTQKVCFRAAERTSIRDFADAKLEREFPVNENEKHFNSPDGKVILKYANSDALLKRLDPQTGAEDEVSIDTVQPVTFSPDGRFFWCRGSASLFDVNQSTSIHVLDGKTLALQFTVEDDFAAPRFVKWAEFSRDSSRIRIEHFWMESDDGNGPSQSVWSIKDGTKISEFGRYYPDEDRRISSPAWKYSGGDPADGTSLPTSPRGIET